MYWTVLNIKTVWQMGYWRCRLRVMSPNKIWPLFLHRIKICVIYNAFIKFKLLGVFLELFFPSYSTNNMRLFILQQNKTFFPQLYLIFLSLVVRNSVLYYLNFFYCVGFYNFWSNRNLISLFTTMYKCRIKYNITACSKTRKPKCK